jgi:hypothetical protein
MAGLPPRWTIGKRPKKGARSQWQLRPSPFGGRRRRGYLLKEAFQQLWEYNSPAWAGKFLDEWCRQTMRSRIERMKKIARSLRKHRELISETTFG